MNSKKVLRDMIGDEGIEALEKAIFKRGTSAVIDPLEYYFPLMVVPRTILAWLINNIKPLKVGEHKEFPFPGKDDIKIYAEKQDIDQYRAEFIQKGRVIHSFEKQSLPAVSAHMMTVGEMYESFGDEKPVETKDDAPKKEAPESQSQDVVRAIMSMNSVSAPQEDPETAKWAYQHANIKELTSVVGKLVDALVAKKSSRDKAEDALDKVSETEVKGDSQKIETTKTPEEKFKEDMKAKDLPTDTEGQFKDAVLTMRDMTKEKYKDGVANGPQAPECKVVDSPDTVTPKKETPVSKEEMPAKKKKSFRSKYGPIIAPIRGEERKQLIQAYAQVPVNSQSSGAAGEEASGGAPLAKPYVSDAQRRWAHTDKGKDALGGEAAVAHWDKESKGKDLPEKFNKEEVTPAERAGGKREHMCPHGRPPGRPCPHCMGIGAASEKKAEILPEVVPKDPKTGKKLIANGPGSVTTEKAEMPSGAGAPKKPAMPTPPKPPVPASKNPQGAAAKQAQASARGDIAKPKTPHAPQMKAPSTGAVKPPAPPKAPGAPAAPKMGKSEYFRNKLKSKSVTKSETYRASEEEIFKGECVHCGKPQFKNDREHPEFDPCACFQVMKSDEEGKPFKFVEAIKKTDGSYELTFDKKSDPEVVKAFVLTLKARLLIKRRFGV